MTMTRIALAAALSGLMLAACGSPGAATADNDVAGNEAGAEPVVPENEAVPTPVQGNGAEPVEADPVPPPDAVSHPDGYLPNASDQPPPSQSPPGSKEPPPATEDQYLRNRQAGG